MPDASLSPTQGMIALGMICTTLIVLAGVGIYQISRAPPEAIGQALVIGATGSAASSVINAASDPPPQGGRRRRHKTPRTKRSRRSLPAKEKKRGSI
jgi:hypothetical protein